MTSFEQARWYSLIEAIWLISNECEQRGKNFNKMKISPLDVQKYIEGTCDAFVRKIEADPKHNPHSAMIPDNTQIIVPMELVEA